MTGTEFTNDQFQNIYPDGIENHYWNHARNNIILRFIRKCGLSNSPLLEIGAGRGIVVKFLHENGINCSGVEHASVIPVNGTADYFYGSTDAFSLPQATRNGFQMIMLLDVIEHVEEPVGFINTILGSFPNIRHLLVTVPARMELWTNYDEYNGHYRRYTLDELKALTSDKIKFYRGGYFNHILYPVFLFYARLIKERETVIMAPKGWQIKVHRLLSWLLQMDYRLLPGSWKGTSAIAVYSIDPLPTNPHEWRGN